MGRDAPGCPSGRGATWRRAGPQTGTPLFARKINGASCRAADGALSQKGAAAKSGSAGLIWKRSGRRDLIHRPPANRKLLQ
jgi:hypothetical protein